MKSWLGKTIAAVRSAAQGKISVQSAVEHVVSPTVAAGEANVHENFFECSFLALGQLCKVDGRVNEYEIEFARQLMERMNLDKDNRQRAMKLFNQGKQMGRELGADIKALVARFGGSSQMTHLMAETMLQGAYADGTLSYQERAWLQNLCHWLNINHIQFGYIQQKVDAQRQVKQQAKRSVSKQAQMNQWYQVLGVTPGANLADVRLAYKRKISQYHPDKLAGMKASPEFSALYEFKARQIRDAYDQIVAAKEK